MTNTATAGQALAAEIRAMYQIGARSRWNRKTGRTVRRDSMIRDLREATGEYRGIESDRRTTILDAAHTALSAYAKFIDGYRIDGVLRFQIMDRTPWEFAAFLGDMVDSGCVNMGEFETWFTTQGRIANAQAA